MKTNKRAIFDGIRGIRIKNIKKRKSKGHLDRITGLQDKGVKKER